MMNVSRPLNAIVSLAQPVLFLLLLVAATQYIEFNGWLAAIDGGIYNRILRNGGQASRDARILVVEIDDDARAECFGNGDVMDPAAVLNLVRGVSAAHPRVIGVDILTDASITASYYRGHAFTVPADVPIVWASAVADGPPPQGPTFWKWLNGNSEKLVVKPKGVLGFAPDELETRNIKWSVPVYAGDEDATIRRFPRTIGLSADPAHSVVEVEALAWPRTVAEEFCGEVPCTAEDADELYISYGGGHKPQEVHMRDIVTCSGAPAAGWSTFAQEARGNLVLIGGTFLRSGDFHATPHDSKTAGLLVNAYAVRAELQGAAFKDVPQPNGWRLDLVVGFALVLIFEALLPWLHERFGLAESRRSKIVAGVTVGLVVILSSRIYANGRYLLGFTCIVLGILAHEVVELRKDKKEHLHAVEPQSQFQPRSDF